MAFKRKIKYFYKGRREWINGKFLNRAERFFLIIMAYFK
jgi:hypothetical protein